MHKCQQEGDLDLTPAVTQVNVSLFSKGLFPMEALDFFTDISDVESKIVKSTVDALFVKEVKLLLENVQVITLLKNSIIFYD